MTEVLYRAATPGDALAIARLFDMARGGLLLHRWEEQAGEKGDPLAFGVKSIASDQGRSSYKNAVLAETGGRVVGLMLGHLEPLADAEPRPDLAESVLRPWKELEALAAGKWVLRAVAVAPAFRGRGIARELLARAELAARKSGADGLAVVAAEENRPPMRLYRLHGYQTLARRRIVPWPDAPHNGDWVLLVKPL